MEFAEHGEGDESGFVDPVGLIGYGVVARGDDLALEGSVAGVVEVVGACALIGDVELFDRFHVGSGDVDHELVVGHDGQFKGAFRH